jgi:hypothetical protein
MKLIQIKTIPEFPEYLVSSDGKIYSRKRSLIPTELKLDTNKFGYGQITLFNGAIKMKKRVHRLVAEAFIPRTTDTFVVNHKDGNKQNNHVDNLEWCSQSDNIKHAYAHGLRKPLGSRHFSSKLTEEKVREIRKLIADGLNNPQIAARYGVVAKSISDIRVGNSWRNVF